MVLDKRELENYLIVPRAIAEFVGRKRRATDEAETPTIDEVTTAIERAADELRPLVVAKRLVRTCRGPFFVNIDVENGASGATDAAEQVDNAIGILCERLEELRSDIGKRSERERVCC
jgi:hypothetical protein